MIPLVSGTVKTLGLGALNRIRELMPYIQIRGVNKVAVRVQEHAAYKLAPSRFTIRTKWYMPRTRFGFNITKWARKEDVTAIVGSQAPWLKMQEEGGTKKPRKQYLAMPMPGIRENRSSVLRKKDRPPALFARKKNKVFVINTKSGPVMFRREGAKLVALYTVEKQAKIRPILEFVKVEREIAGKVYAEEFRKAFVEMVAKKL